MVYKIIKLSANDKELKEELSNTFLDKKINSKFFLDNKNIILIAISNNKIVGYLYAYLLDSIDIDLPKMFLYSIDVIKDYREKGIGKALISRLKIIAKERKCSEIFVITNKSNKAAINLYHSSKGIFEADDDIVFIIYKNNF